MMSRYHISVVALSFVCMFAGCTESQQSKGRGYWPELYTVHTKIDGLRVPAYKIVDVDEITKEKLQVTVNVVLQQDTLKANSENLRTLLFGLFAAFRDTPLTMSKQKPTHIFVFIYATVEHFHSGMGQWVGRVACIGYGSSPEIEVDERNLTAISLPKDDSRLGVTESERQRIFEEVVRAEDNASALGIPFEKARQEVADKHGLTYIQIMEILAESSDKNWPLP